MPPTTPRPPTPMPTPPPGKRMPRRSSTCDSSARSPSSNFTLRWSLIPRPLLGQVDRESRATFRLAGDLNAAAVSRHDLARQPQTQAKPTEVLLGDGPLEALEDALLVVIRDADPLVAHGHPAAVPAILDRDVHGAPGAVFDGVVDQ